MKEVRREVHVKVFPTMLLSVGVVTTLGQFMM